MSVTVVGSANVDVVVGVPRIPGPGETLLADSLARGGGGKGANQAVAAARSGGAEVAFVGSVGDDADGRMLLGALAADGIDVSTIAVTDRPTGTAFISVDAAGENSIVVVSGANASTADLTAPQLAAIGRAGVVVAQLEIPVERVIAAAEARSAGTRLVLNAAPAEPLAEASVAARVLALVDVLVVNEHELAVIAAALAPAVSTEPATTEEAIAVLAREVPALVVTLGSSGAVIRVGDESRRVGAVEVTAVDTTGAGDTYCGVLAAVIDERGGDVTIDGLEAAAVTAAAAAAIAVGRAGAQAAVPTTAEVAALLTRAA